MNRIQSVYYGQAVFLKGLPLHDTCQFSLGICIIPPPTQSAITGEVRCPQKFQLVRHQTLPTCRRREDTNSISIPTTIPKFTSRRFASCRRNSHSTRALQAKQSSRTAGRDFLGVTPPMTDVARRIDDMDRVGIDVEV